MRGEPRAMLKSLPDGLETPAPRPAAGSGQFRGSKMLLPRNVSFGQFVSNYSRMIFGEPCNEPPLIHRRPFGLSVPHHPIESGVASHNKTR
jgi:hypothetical protein